MKLIEEVHDKLNPLLFDEESYEMLPNIREKLLEVANEFISQVSPDVEFQVLDIRVVGSNASFNYSSTSDIDLHLVVDFSSICRDCPDIVKELFNSEKSRFNINYDINFNCIPVEIYVEDVRAGTMSSGIYSVYFNQWIKFPSITTTNNSEKVLNSSEFQDKYNRIKARCERVISLGDSRDISKTIDDLYLMRKTSLETDGESGSGNLVFKKLRSEGILDRLKDTYYDKRSEELSDIYY